MRVRCLPRPFRKVPCIPRCFRIVRRPKKRPESPKITSSIVTITSNVGPFQKYEERVRLTKKSNLFEPGGAMQDGQLPTQLESFGTLLNLIDNLAPLKPLMKPDDQFDMDKISNPYSLMSMSLSEINQQIVKWKQKHDDLSQMFSHRCLALHNKLPKTLLYQQKDINTRLNKAINSHGSHGQYDGLILTRLEELTKPIFKKLDSLAPLMSDGKGQWPVLRMTDIENFEAFSHRCEKLATQLQDEFLQRLAWVKKNMPPLFLNSEATNTILDTIEKNTLNGNYLCSQLFRLEALCTPMYHKLCNIKEWLGYNITDTHIPDIMQMTNGDFSTYQTQCNQLLASLNKEFIERIDCLRRRVFLIPQEKKSKFMEHIGTIEIKQKKCEVEYAPNGQNLLLYLEGQITSALHVTIRYEVNMVRQVIHNFQNKENDGDELPTIILNLNQDLIPNPKNIDVVVHHLQIIANFQGNQLMKAGISLHKDGSMHRYTGETKLQAENYPKPEVKLLSVLRKLHSQRELIKLPH